MNGRVRVIQANTIADTFWAFTEGQLKYLNGCGFDIHAVTSPGPLFEKFRQRENIPVHGVPMKREISLLNDIVSFCRLCRVINRVKPVIIHGSTPKAGFLSMLAGSVIGLPVRIFFMRGLRSSTLQGWKKKLVKSMEKLTCKMADQVICTSNSVRTLAIAEEICAPDRIKVLHNGTGNGINTRRFDPARFSEQDRERIRQDVGIPDKARVLLFAGRVVREKGIVELMGAWERLKIKRGDLHLVLAGGWAGEDRLPHELRHITGENERLHVLGEVEDVAPLYSIADIFVLPSYREGIPIAVLEASAMGVPVITTKIPGCIDAVEDGVTGILIPPRDEEAIFLAVSKILDDEQYAKTLGVAGRQRVEALFRPEAIWNALSREYVSLLSKKGIDTSFYKPQSAQS